MVLAMTDSGPWVFDQSAAAIAAAARENSIHLC
jgi:hypothetical protein